MFVFHVKQTEPLGARTNMIFAKLLYSLDLVAYIRRDRRRVDSKAIFCISN